MPGDDVTPGPTFALRDAWQRALLPEFTADYMLQLRAFLIAQKAAGHHIYPKSSEWFRALELTPPDDVRVVLLGQDPYHGPDQAHGLCFSAPPGVRIPPSLRNIYKELQADLGISPAPHGFLDHWARQGVLLLNSVLTVEAGQAASHAGKGWERFTDAVIRQINDGPQRVVFLLWGAYAQRKGGFIDRERHLVLTAAHPSPLSAHHGFLGCRHFSQANDWLVAQGRTPIDWALPPIDGCGLPLAAHTGIAAR